MTMYLIALVLPEPLNKEILKLKNRMLENYGCRVGLKSPAHITLVPPFWMEEVQEADLMSDMDKIAMTIKPFTVLTNNFSAFKPRTIFIAVAPNEALAACKRETDHFLSAANKYPIKKELRPFHPHITIATRDISKKAFHEAWPYFESEIFAADWQAEGISLLRHNKKIWEVSYTAGYERE